MSTRNLLEDFGKMSMATPFLNYMAPCWLHGDIGITCGEKWCLALSPRPVTNGNMHQVGAAVLYQGLGGNTQNISRSPQRQCGFFTTKKPLKRFFSLRCENNTCDLALPSPTQKSPVTSGIFPKLILTPDTRQKSRISHEHPGDNGTGGC